MQKAVAVIPARFHSTRLPGKPLASLKGKILVQHVYEKVLTAKSIDTVFVATDDRRISEAVTVFGGRAIMTSSDHQSGTDRVAEAVRDIDCEIVVNIQGDEPFIKPEMIDDTVALLRDDPRASISTLAKKTADLHEIFSPHIAKVVMDSEGFALYFSRAPIPYYRNDWNVRISGTPEQESALRIVVQAVSRGNTPSSFYCLKHIGIYGYRKEALLNLAGMQQGLLEHAEKLEQLRALQTGMKIKVKETEYETFGIDTEDDLRKAEQWLSTYS